MKYHNYAGSKSAINAWPAKYDQGTQSDIISEALSDDHSNYVIDDINFEKDFTENTQHDVASQVATVVDETDKQLKALFPLVYRPAAHVQAKSQTGRKFNVSRGLLQNLKLPPSKFVDLTKGTAQDFVLTVTALKDTTMSKLSATILNIQQYFTGYRIIVIDLGLKKQDAVKVKSWCNVIYRQFDFTAYPSHVRQLRTYAWRPLVIQDVLRDFSGVFLIEQPFKVHLSKLTDVLQKIASSGGIHTFKPTGHSIYSATHPEMYAYLPTNTGRLMAIRMWAFTNALFFNTRSMYKGVLYWWYLCALDRNCISPTNSTSSCPLVSNKPNLTHFSTYFKECHRHDQSALNIILANHFNFDVSNYSMYKPETVFESEKEIGDQRGHSSKDLIVRHREFGFCNRNSPLDVLLLPHILCDGNAKKWDQGPEGEDRMDQRMLYRPELDWSPDAELSQRFRSWKRQIDNEVKLQLAEDPEKRAVHACVYVIICSGEHGEHIIKESGLFGE
ncbi:hypothetical protein CAPTEDRAFT_184987 [Capitella teleta]|uniref:Uncharacterized protein n=1 Tax=Capitella teleta TaxID=283909 RepID=R7TBS2_CAPTE|nr:hypothetical protein CAPTEDRAFT_184987 [Capitella teleta]|eukprot:ELT88546.1 hypothetical protein CAPTEDRAFT_184987 [Capitella teleta]